MQLLLLVAVSFAFPARTHGDAAIAEPDQVERPSSTTAHHAFIPAIAFDNMAVKDFHEGQPLQHRDQESGKSAASVVGDEERTPGEVSELLSGVVAGTVEKGALEVAKAVQAESSLATKVAGRLSAAGPGKALRVAPAAKIAKPQATKGTGTKKAVFMTATGSKQKAAKYRTFKPAVATEAKTNGLSPRVIAQRYGAQKRLQRESLDLKGVNGIPRDLAVKIERRPKKALTIGNAKQQGPITKKEETEGGETRGDPE